MLTLDAELAPDAELMDEVREAALELDDELEMLERVTVVERELSVLCGAIDNCEDS